MPPAFYFYVVLAQCSAAYCAAPARCPTMQPASRDPLVYVLIAIPVAVAFALLTPPMQTPDEVGHYWRAVAISQGELVSAKHGGRPSSLIPRASRDLVATVWMEMAGQPVKYDAGRIRRARELRESEERVRVHFPAFYTAVPYTPRRSRSSSRARWACRRCMPFTPDASSTH